MNINDDFQELATHEKELMQDMEQYEQEINKINGGDIGKLKQIIKEIQLEADKEQTTHLNLLLADILSFYKVENEILGVIFDENITPNPNDDCIINFKRAFPDLADNISKLIYEIPIPPEQQNIRKINYGWKNFNFQKRLSDDQMNLIKEKMKNILNKETMQKEEGRFKTIKELALIYNYQVETNKDDKGVEYRAEYSIMDTILLGFAGFFSQTILYEQAKELLMPYDNEEHIIDNVLSKSYTRDDKFKFGVNLIEILANGCLLNEIKKGENAGKYYYEEQNQLKNKKHKGEKDNYKPINKYIKLWCDEIIEICETYPNKAYKTIYELEGLIYHLSSKSNPKIFYFLQEFFKKKWEAYKDYETHKTYLKTDEGFKEIEMPDLVLMIKQTFKKLINYNSIKRLLDEAITEPVTSNYNLISFRNGVLNTTTEQFHEGMKLETFIPKIYIYDYDFIQSYEEAEKQFKETDLYNELSEALKISDLTDKEKNSTYQENFKNNEHLFFMGVGNSAMATNEMEKMFILNGKPGTMKSTILQMLKRVFNAVPISLQTISDGNQFSLVSTVRKDIAIDDDVSTTLIKNNGRLNSFITQTSLSAEIKGKNEIIDLTGSIVPCLWGSGNNLPSINKEGGFTRRVCLIILNNLIDPDKKTKRYMNDIIRGKRDSEIVKMLNYSIHLFFKNRDNSELSAETQKVMVNEWNLKSFPVKILADELYMDTIDFETEAEAIGGVEKVEYKGKEITLQYNKYENGKLDLVEEDIKTYTPANEVTREIRKAFKEAKENGRIIEETQSPTPKQIKAGMNANSFEFERMSAKDSKGDWIKDNVFLECIPREKLKSIKEKCVEKKEKK